MDLSQVWMTAPHWAQGASPFFSRPIWEVLVNITVVIPKWMASNSLVIFQRVAVGFPGCDLFVFCLCKGFGFFGFRVFEASWQNMRLQAQALTCDAEWPAARTNPQTTVCQYKNSQRTADLKTFSFVMNWASRQSSKRIAYHKCCPKPIFTAPEEMVIMRPKLDLHHVSPAHKQGQDSKSLDYTFQKVAMHTCWDFFKSNMTDSWYLSNYEK